MGLIGALLNIVLFLAFHIPHSRKPTRDKALFPFSWFCWNWATLSSSHAYIRLVPPGLTLRWKQDPNQTGLIQPHYNKACTTVSGPLLHIGQVGSKGTCLLRRPSLTPKALWNSFYKNVLILWGTTPSPPHHTAFHNPSWEMKEVERTWFGAVAFLLA